MTSRRAAAFSWRCAGLFAVGRKKLASRIASISAGVGTAPVALRRLGDRAQDVVDGLAVAELGRESRLEADQVAQPERRPAVEERGQLAVAERDRIVARRRCRGSIAGGTDVLGLDS